MILLLDKDVTVDMSPRQRLHKVLLQRALTAVVLAIFFVLATTQASPLVFAHIMTAIMMFVSWEWSTLAGLKANLHKLLFVSGTFIVLVVMYFFLDI